MMDDEKVLRGPTWTYGLTAPVIGEGRSFCETRELCSLSFRVPCWGVAGRGACPPPAGGPSLI